MKFENLNTTEAINYMYNIGGKDSTVLESRFFPKGFAKNPIHLVLLDFSNVKHYLLHVICESPDISRCHVVNDLYKANELFKANENTDFYWPLYELTKTKEIGIEHHFNMVKGYRFIDYLLKNDIKFDRTGLETLSK